MQTMLEVREDRQTVANHYVVDVDDGSHQLVAPPVRFDDVTPSLRRTPEHAEHTEEVLLEIGLDWDEIVRHKERGVIS